MKTYLKSGGIVSMKINKKIPLTFFGCCLKLKDSKNL